MAKIQDINSFHWSCGALFPSLQIACLWTYKPPVVYRFHFYAMLMTLNDGDIAFPVCRFSADKIGKSLQFITQPHLATTI